MLDARRKGGSLDESRATTDAVIAVAAGVDAGGVLADSRATIVVVSTIPSDGRM